MNKQTGKLVGQPLNGAMIFDTPDAMFEAMFGPAQQDAHVGTRRLHQRLAARKAHADAADALFAAKIKQYGSISAWLAAEPTKMGSST